jgi:heme exporter protein D
MIHWNSFSDFLAMGGYGLYVWGSFGMCALVLAAECWGVAQRRKALRELPNPLADFKAPKTAPKPGAQPVVIDGVTIQRIE